MYNWNRSGITSYIWDDSKKDNKMNMAIIAVLFLRKGFQ